MTKYEIDQLAAITDMLTEAQTTATPIVDRVRAAIVNCSDDAMLEALDLIEAVPLDELQMVTLHLAMVVEMAATGWSPDPCSRSLLPPVVKDSGGVPV